MRIIYVIGENWENRTAEEICVDFNPRMQIEITIPFSEKTGKVLIKGQIYICKNSVCTVEKICYVINVKHSDQIKKSACCTFSHDISN